MRAHEAMNIQQVAKITAVRALERKESRFQPYHYRADFPETDNKNYCGLIVVKKGEGKNHHPFRAPVLLSTRRTTMPPVIDMEKCNGCGICDKHCPLDVIYMVKKRRRPVSGGVLALWRLPAGLSHRSGRYRFPLEHAGDMKRFDDDH